MKKIQRIIIKIDNPNPLHKIKKFINNIEINLYKILNLLKQNLNSEPRNSVNLFHPNQIPSSIIDKDKE